MTRNHHPKLSPLNLYLNKTSLHIPFLVNSYTLQAYEDWWLMSNFPQCKCNVRRSLRVHAQEYVQLQTYSTGSRRGRDLRIIFFAFESNFQIESAVYTTQAVTPSNELQGAPCKRIMYLSRTRVMHATEYLLFISI